MSYGLKLKMKLTPWGKWVNITGAVAQNPFRSLKRISDHSKVRFTANPKLALRAQTLGLRPFHFTENGYQKFFNVRSRDLGNRPYNDPIINNIRTHYMEKLTQILLVNTINT